MKQINSISRACSSYLVVLAFGCFSSGSEIPYNSHRFGVAYRRMRRAADESSARGLCQATTADARQRILGGQVARQGDMPFAAVLLAPDDKGVLRQFCGATIVGDLLNRKF